MNKTLVDSHRWVVRTTILCVVLIFSVGILDVLYYYYQLFPSEIVSRSFNIGAEASFGTWVSISLSLFAGLAALAVSQRTFLELDRKTAVGWLLVGLFFIFISFDDAAKFHERLGSALHYKVEDMTDTELASWFPSWGWQLYLAPFFVLAGAGLCWFFYTVLERKFLLWVLLGFTLLGIAVAIDFVEGMVVDTEQNVHFMRLVEEMLEMLGLTAFLYAFLNVLVNGLEIQISSPNRPRAGTGSVDEEQ